MTSPNIIRFEPRHYQRGNVTNLHGATVTRLSERRSLVSRYQDSCRQADVLNASLGELWLRAYLASINYALVIAGVAHTQQGGANQCAIPAGKNPEDFREPA